jgi:hypothetical protein
VLDDQNAVGVMHLGDFPNGLEFATFVMARNNYPFEKMSVEDHLSLFRDPRTSVPTPGQLEGQWNGSLIFVPRPNSTLLNQLSPVVFQVAFVAQGTQWRAQYKFGLLTGASNLEMTPEFAKLNPFALFQDEIRMIDDETMIGRWILTEEVAVLADPLKNYLELGSNSCSFYYILTRTKP